MRKKNNTPNKNHEWLLEQYQNTTMRYKDAENFIINELLEMNWYERLFLNSKILRWYSDHSKKYNKNSIFHNSEIYNYMKMPFWKKMFHTLNIK